MGRKLLALFVGILSGGLIIGVTETIGHKIFPLPKGFDVNDPVQLQSYIEKAPTAALLFVVLAWFLGVLAGSAITFKMVKVETEVPSYILGTLFLFGGIVQMVMIKHPMWFNLVGTLCFFPAVSAGIRLVKINTT